MITILAGGKPHQPWLQEITSEYEKRLKKPFQIKWEFYEEEKLLKKLSNWPFSGNDFVILTDERGENLSSPAFAKTLEKAQISSKNIIILIGGAYGFPEEIRQKSDLIWSFSNLVFPHQIARLIVAEQIYRAQEILAGSPYHHI